MFDAGSPVFFTKLRREQSKCASEVGFCVGVRATVCSNTPRSRRRERASRSKQFGCVAGGLVKYAG